MSKKKAPAKRPSLLKANIVLKERALQLNNEGWQHASIARELKITPGTLRRWFRDAGLPPKGSGSAPNTVVGDIDPDPIGTALAAGLEGTSEELATAAQLAAKDLEHEEIAVKTAEALTPADQYQAYVATHGMRLLRDGIRQVKPPRTIAELDQLDKIVRRSLGLEGKTGNGGGGGGSLRIDLKILNNPVASPDGANVTPAAGYVVDVEALEAQTREQHAPLNVELPDLIRDNPDDSDDSDE